MVRKKVTLGMLAIVLAFSLTVAGCSDNGGGSSILDEFNLQSGTPPAGTAGLTTEQFNAIITAGQGGYQGFEFDGHWLDMVWTGRTVTQLDLIRDAVVAAGLGAQTFSGSETYQGVTFTYREGSRWFLEHSSGGTLNYDGETVNYPVGFVLLSVSVLN